MNKRFFSRLWIKFIIWVKRKYDPHSFQKITKTEKDAMDIFNSLVKDSESELLIHPYLDKYYIKSAKTGIFIILITQIPEISIINHIYGYNVKLSARVSNNMIKTFLGEVENKRLSMEKEYTDNIQYSLNHISKTIKAKI